MGIKFSNNASANIIQALTSTATSVSVTAGKGDLFPLLTEGDYFYATLVGNNGLEIVKVTNRVKDTMTIVRAQDNTTALSFDTGDLLELRIVAADFNDTITEINNKLESSIEETISDVNSALSNKAPLLHASSSTEYGAGSSEQYGHLKSHDSPGATKTAAMGHAFSPAGAAAMQYALEGQIGNLAGVVSANAAAQAQKDAEQDTAIKAAQTAASKALVSAVIEDGELVLTYGDGTVKRESLPGGLPLGTLMPYTGKDVPAGFLRADGATYTNMRASFPEFFDWVVSSGLTVPLAEYTLVEGSCGAYGLDESTGTVRMPTLDAGVFGTTAAGQYGAAVQAGLPGIAGSFTLGRVEYVSDEQGAFTSTKRTDIGSNSYSFSTSSKIGYTIDFNASSSNPIYGRSDTVQPPHVKYPWVISVYSSAVPASTAQANQFVGLLDGKADKEQIITPKAYITETWASGTSWYRKWNDGWIEQGGALTIGATGTTTFHTAYTSAPTVFFAGVTTRKTSSYDLTLYPDNVTSTNFSYTEVFKEGASVRWFASGY